MPVAAPTQDFGDAPDSYATTLATNGARHIAAGPSLGASRDVEFDGLVSAQADGDDNNAGDDEDGVTMVPLTIGATGVPVTVNVQGVPALLDAWIDFDGSGTWEPSEQVFTSEPLVVGDNALTISVSLSAIAGNTYARFRLSTAGGLLPMGQSNDGEVEDYAIIINTPPVAKNDRVILAQDTTVTINVLANNGYGIGSDSDGDSISIDSTTQPTQGAVVIDSASTVTYTPTTGFVGNDSFQYTVIDGNGGTATATAFVTVDPFGTIVLDNLSSEFSIVSGAWGTSSAVTGFVGSNYRFAINGNNTSRFNPVISSAGAYEVFANWTSDASRATNASFDVVHASGSTTVHVDQTQNGGTFQSLGIFSFVAGQSQSVAVRTLGTNGSVVADAIRWVPVTATTIELDKLSPSFAIQSGSWGTSSTVSEFVGSNYRYAVGGNKTASFSPTIDVAGSYEVFANWTSDSGRATNASFDIVHAGGTTTVNVDQTQNGGEFQSLGIFTFDAGQSQWVAVRTLGTSGSVVADAIRWVPVPTTTIELDNLSPSLVVESGSWGPVRLSAVSLARTIDTPVVAIRRLGSLRRLLQRGPMKCSPIGPAIRLVPATHPLKSHTKAGRRWSRLTKLKMVVSFSH
uniref:golvesin C-terminal-like domain-containing protein n=1 Tax=Neorhodopirellula lusitana TaxID=445327 RepID=UPI00384B7640